MFNLDCLNSNSETEPDIDNGLSTNHLEELFYSKSRRYLSNADDMFTAMKCAYLPSNSDRILNREHLINVNFIFLKCMNTKKCI